MINEKYSDIIKKYKTLKSEYSARDDLRCIRVAILSGSTVGYLKEILELSLLHLGISPVFFEGQYNNYFEEGAFDNPTLTEFKPDFVYIHTTSRNIDFDNPDELYLRFVQIWDNMSRYGAVIIQNNFEPLPYRAMGNGDVYLETGKLYTINALNERFYENARKRKNLYINDINYLCAMYGGERWWNDRYWYAYKYAFDLEVLPLLCNSIANIVKSVMGMNKKALVLDLDHTIWGGVIGDDGVDGIQLGDETPEGMAYRDFQSYIKSLSKAGVILNVVSKNEENVAIEAFKHPSSILKRHDFISFKANWEPKHKNIADIASELNIGLDSIVFIDDNLAELEIVRKYLPNVTVLETGSVERLIRILDKECFFEVTSFSDADRQRTEYYKKNKQRADRKKLFSNIDDYLVSLEMKCLIEPFNLLNAERIIQLINKTNQFNLTVKRYTSIDCFLDNKNYMTLCARLTDKFGDNGIVSAMVASINEDTAVIDLWIMSCRVFKRNLEYAFFDFFLDKCKVNDIKLVRGYYVPTSKNNIVSNLYADLGFVKEKNGRGLERWVLKVEDYNFSRIGYIRISENFTL